MACALSAPRNRGSSSAGSGDLRARQVVGIVVRARAATQQLDELDRLKNPVRARGLATRGHVQARSAAGPTRSVGTHHEATTRSTHAAVPHRDKERGDQNVGIEDGTHTEESALRRLPACWASTAGSTAWASGETLGPEPVEGFGPLAAYCTVSQIDPGE